MLLNQGVADVNRFIRVFRERLIDCMWQNWNYDVQNSNRFDFYRLFRPLHCIPTYIAMDLGTHVKRIMTRFRFCVSDILCSLLSSQTNSCSQLRLSNMEGDTRRWGPFRIVLSSPALTYIREQFIPPKYYRKPCLFQLTLLMSPTSEETCKAVCYLFV